MKHIQEKYKTIIVPALMKEFNYTSIMQVPIIKKITLNMGVGKSILDKKYLHNAIEDLTLISGQKPYITKAKKSISGFKIRQGNSIGCKVTLRGKRMWDFFEKLISIAIPRIRDFRGFSTSSFDNRSNYHIGIHEQIIFPEINYDTVNNIRGLNINIIISSKSYKESYALLSLFKFPFRQKKVS